VRFSYGFICLLVQCNILQVTDVNDVALLFLEVVCLDVVLLARLTVHIGDL